MKALLESVNLDYKYSLSTLASPVNVYLKVTGICDLRCTFCSQYNEKVYNMPIDSAKKLLKELKDIGVISINYTGGEPLLYKHIKDLLKYGYELGFEQILVTNGVHLFDEEDLLKYINIIGISLHGEEETHDRLCGKTGVYNIVTKNINRLIEDYKDIKVLINYTLSKDSINDKDINSVVSFAKDKKINLCFGRINYIGASLNSDIIEPDSYLEKINKVFSIYDNITVSNCIIPCAVSSKYEHLTHSCGAGQTMYSIEANGDVKICPSSTFVLGNAFKNGFLKTIKSKYIKKFHELSWLPNVCMLCKKFPSCKGGCHAEGNREFFNNTCDAILLNKFDKAWEEIKNKKIVTNNYMIKKEKKSYLIIKVPLRKINYTGYNLLKKIDGSKTAQELLEKNSNISNVRDFIITLYLENMIKVVE